MSALKRDAPDKSENLIKCTVTLIWCEIIMYRDVHKTLSHETETETETLYLQDRDETRRSQKTSRLVSVLKI